jgi:transcriptional regulator with XRE-family HTH domain
MSTFGERLREERLLRKLTQQALADQIAVDRKTVNRWENGISRPSTDNLEALAVALRFDMAYLITGQRAPALPAATAPAPAAPAPSRPSFFARLLACLRGH